MQLYAGAISEGIFKILEDVSTDGFDAKRAVEMLSIFDLELIGVEQKVPPPPWCAVLDNILSRGTPTLASPYVESVLAKRLNLTEQKTSDIGNISFDFQPSVDPLHYDDVMQTLRRSLVIIEPRLKETDRLLDFISLQSWEVHFGSKFESRFFHGILSDVIGVYARQLAEPQRPIQTILRQIGREQDNLQRRLANLAKNFFGQRVDFAFEFPTTENEKRGLVVEIDGSQHDEEPLQSTLDAKRDEAVKKAGWLPTLRIRTKEFPTIPDEKSDQLKSFFAHKYAQIAAENYGEPFWLNDLSRRVFQLVLVPIAVARIQKVLVQFIKSGVLRLGAEPWKIAVHERDVPCAWLAVADFLQLLSHLLQLQGKAFTPKVEVRAYYSEKFANAELGEAEPDISFGYQREKAGFRAELADHLDDFDADVLIDVSVLQRKGFTTIEQSLQKHIPTAKTAVIRSVHSIYKDRVIATSEPISYHLDSPEKKKALGYFLRTIFRKKAFREGQVEILRRSLARQDVIGLLPTGAGKSLCYQLSALLQPGITLVVDPLKSLMSDQNDNLIAAGIDATVFINSTLKKKERIENIRRFKLGHFQFAFISPERLLIEEFRQALTKKWFAYCVVDEAHCVSEWGHDFRTAYLRLGENARNFCKPTSGDLPIIALTGTASYDVLSDVQQELNIKDENAIVTPKTYGGTYARDELTFKILPTPQPEIPAGADALPIKEAVATRKREFLVQWLKNIANQFEVEPDGTGNVGNGGNNFFELHGERTNSGIVFCPHVGWVFGVTEIADDIRREIPELCEHVGVFASRLEEDEEAPVLQETQRQFKQNKLSLLVATKAFGMGIDKPNIRYTVHFNMPPSIEAFYQEAGRAGRDRNKAVCVLLFSDDIRLNGQTVFADKDLMLDFHAFAFKGTEKEKGIVYELLNELPEDPPGIKHRLKAMRDGEKRQIFVKFENDRIQQITNFLRNRIDSRFYSKLVRDSCNWCSDSGKFIENLNKKFWNNFGTWPAVERFAPQLEADFLRIRFKEDTFKAIYRLSLVGIISDYVVDYNAEVIKPTIQKRPNGEYITALQTYISRYVSREEAQQVEQDISIHRGESTIQKCVGYLIDFVYKKIAKKREEAIDRMEEAARVGARDGDFKTYVNTYFDSRYLPELRQYLYDYPRDVIWRYIEAVNGEFDSTNHLLGACNRLLGDNPDNPVFLWLRAYARFVIDDFSNDDAIRDFLEGFARLEAIGMDWQSLISVSSTFHEYVTAQNRDASPPIIIAIIQLHLRWLNDFNNDFWG
ncbi:DEAD/DEAH box helicase [Candidatus Poribacteria bacterium]|nr:DEAD/DEAH box helicase [Candidatus Poribacteria bacterium]